MVIVRAAILYSNGETIQGHTYGAITSLSHKLSYPQEDRIYGFVTSSEAFVLPSEAMTIALEAGQVTVSADELTPDMLWGDSE